MDVELRDVTDADIEVFFEHQADPASSAMAAVGSRERDAHKEHWIKSLAQPGNVAKTIIVDDEVAGHCVSWVVDGERYVGYWIARSMWGRGIATAALTSFLKIVRDRPLFATVAPDNGASLRVLHKAGFVRTGVVPDPNNEGETLVALELL